MKTKLTLVMEDEVIYNAKKYAKKKEESLSSLVENYLKAISGNTKTLLPVKSKSKKTISLIEKYRGIISLPEDYDYKKKLVCIY
jgi:predicted RNA-binding protein Jag